MSQLRDRIMQSPREATVVRECAHMIESFLSGAGGMKGFTLRSALHTAQRARPDLLEQSSRRLLPEFLDALDPYYQKWDPSTEPDFAAQLMRHEDAACDAVLAVADARAQRSSNRVVTSIYSRMRGGARKDVERVFPELATLIARELNTQNREAD
ncbi:DUF6918 family protein [Algiphilus aromaticivorans]|jgi:hypothetical protein|uniref:DUF6918 family protein n=1 Tax=Algiphilus aromaticivorans TaxID=382454 RepID=UPI0005C17238|nr:hypothetical protein [Algiphilus aromaticivorans]